MRPDAVAPGQPAFVHGVIGQLDQGVGHPLLVAAIVVRSQPLGQRIQGCAQRRTTDGIKDAVDHMHAIREHADVEPAPREVGFRLVEEAIGVGDMAGDAAEEAQP